MSYVVAAPAALANVATDIAGIGSALSAANAAAVAPTSGLAAAAADEVSGALASFFNSYAQEYRALST
ncbi:MAG: PE family protein, partial [Mycobacterium sp.]